MRKHLLSAGLFLFALLLLLKVDPGTGSVEKRIYTHYTTSLVDDLDLNVVNQVPAKEAWLLTSSLNYPDVHSNGVAVLWAPFFAGARLLGAGSGNDRLAQAAASVFWALIALALVWELLTYFFSKQTSVTSVLILLLCTPFLWYALEQPENADVTALAVSLGLLNLYVRRRQYPETAFAFFGGAALFFAVAVKFDLIFYGLLFLHFIFEKRAQGLKKLATLNLAFAAGSALLLAPLLLNETLKDGFFNYGYADTFTSQVYLLGENLFGPSGYFSTHPFYALLLVVFAVLGVKNKTPAQFWFFLAIPVAEIVLESFNYSHNESFGPRHWVDDTGCFALLLGYVLSLPGRISHRRVFYGLCLVSCMVSLAAATVYHADFSTFYYGGAWTFHPGDFVFWYRLPWLNAKLNALWGLGALALAATLALRSGSARWLTGFFAAGALAYLAATALNYANNAKSAARVPQLVANAVIGNGPAINSFFENAGCLQRAEVYYTLRGQPESAALRRRMLDAYVLRAASEIVRDPVNFRAQLKPGQKIYVPEELWSDE